MNAWQAGSSCIRRRHSRRATLYAGVAALLASALVTSAPAFAARPITTFSGALSWVSPEKPYGLDIATFESIAGRFLYDPNVPPSYTIPNLDAAGYIQNIFNGFSFRAGDARIQIDSYIVEVGNDVPQPDESLADVLSVYFARPGEHPLAPIAVNGVQKHEGHIRIDLLAPPDWLTDSALPESVEGAVFHTRLGIFSDDMLFVDAFFMPSSVEAAEFVPGDYTQDGAVDGRDLLAWQRQFGLAAAAADGDSSGLVDSGDLTVWSDNLGTVASAAASTAVSHVPEPRAAALASAAAVAAGAVARRRRSHPSASQLRATATR